MNQINPASDTYTFLDFTLEFVEFIRQPFQNVQQSDLDHAITAYPTDCSKVANLTVENGELKWQARESDGFVFGKNIARVSKGGTVVIRAVKKLSAADQHHTLVFENGELVDEMVE